MTNFTTNTYTLKREILNFSNKVSQCLSKPDRKFTADITYGMLASGSCLLTDVADQLHEDSKKINSVERLSRHLNKGVLTKSNHPISIYSKIHSSQEKSFTSVNTITFEAMERAKALFGKATFVMDRGYDDNKMFLKLDSLEQDYVIRLTAKRKLLFHNKWVPATELRNRRKGKIKMPVFYRGKQHQAYLSHVKVQITASRKDINLVLVYGITEHPMMLATNKELKSKDDVVRIARLYFSRWRIEEYFRCKKQVFQFEKFRVRKLVAINALNFYITLCMAFFASISMKSETNALKVSILQIAAPIRQKVQFHYYRFAKGISGILSYAKEGVRLWFKTERPVYRQLSFKLIA